ncbi:hypothetical protein HCC30_25365, partial [Streptomyces sp. HNM0574]|nr:hypothetical protein [Streptomyces sp. HNM0574]
MQINGAQGGTHGYALLIAASPHSRNPAMKATDALPALAAVPPGTLLGTSTASVVQLADPDDPNVVLSHLRTAAAHDGPLLVHVAGLVMLDSRQHLPHLALAKSTARTVRYTGLPWHWLQAELQTRPPGTTTVLADLVADDELWQRRGETQLTAGPATYGVLVPNRSRRRGGPPAAPVYSQAVAAVLRSVGGAERPDDATLHQQAVAHSGLPAHDPTRLQLLAATTPLPHGNAPTTAPAPEPPTAPGPVPHPTAGPMPPAAPPAGPDRTPPPPQPGPAPAPPAPEPP